MTACEQGVRSAGKAPARTRRVLIAAVVAAVTLVVVVANAHLVYVAVTSQPDCVAHVKRGQSSSAAFSAAQSAC